MVTEIPHDYIEWGSGPIRYKRVRKHATLDSSADRSRTFVNLFSIVGESQLFHQTTYLFCTKLQFRIYLAVVKTEARRSWIIVNL